MGGLADKQHVGVRSVAQLAPTEAPHANDRHRRRDWFVGVCGRPPVDLRVEGRFQHRVPYEGQAVAHVGQGHQPQQIGTRDAG